MTRPHTEEDRRQVFQDIVPHLWHEPILRLLATAPTRFRDIRTQLNATHGNKAPLDGQISKALRSLGELGYVQKPSSKHSPWFLTDFGNEAVSILDRAYRATDTDSAPMTAADKVETSLGGRHWRMAVDGQVALGIDTTRAHPARRYNYLLGGKDNFKADRDSGDEFIKLFPSARLAAVENRAFLKRATRYLAAQAGIRQFLDIGTGLPTADNTHEVAQAIAPESRIVYVDNDPMVLIHARALLTGSSEGATAYIDADLQDPESILTHPQLLEVIDLSEPVGLMLVAVLHFIHGDNAVKPIVDRLLSALPAGSHVVVSHVTHEFLDEETRNAHQGYVKAGKSDVWARSLPEFASLFDGLKLIAPGIVQVSEWRQDMDTPTPAKEQIGIWGAVGRKP